MYLPGTILICTERKTSPQKSSLGGAVDYLLTSVNDGAIIYCEIHLRLNINTGMQVSYFL